MTGGLDKLADIAGAASNPLSAAKSSVEAARGLMNETYGLVEDARGIAEKEAARREKKRDESAMKQTLSKEKATKTVTRRDTNSVVSEYNSNHDAVKEATRQALIKIRQREEEHAHYWSMSQEERQEYDKVRREQVEKIRKEQLRITREKYARKERNELILGIVISTIMFLVGSYFIFNWLVIQVRGESLIEYIKRN